MVGVFIGGTIVLSNDQQNNIMMLCGSRTFLSLADTKKIGTSKPPNRQTDSLLLPWTNLATFRATPWADRRLCLAREYEGGGDAEENDDES